MTTSWIEAVCRWKLTEIPGGSSIDSVDEMHADLVYWDALVANEVIPLDEGGDVRYREIDIKAGLAEFHKLLSNQVAKATSSAERVQLERYRYYCELLQEVHSVVEQRLSGE